MSAPSASMTSSRLSCPATPSRRLVRAHSCEPVCVCIGPLPLPLLFFTCVCLCVDVSFVFVAVCLSVSASHSPSTSLSLTLPLTLFLPLCLSLDPHLSHSLCVRLSLPPPSLPVSVYLTLCIPCVLGVACDLPLLFHAGGEGAGTVPKSSGAVSSAPFGSAMILPIPWMYINMLGQEGLRKATQVCARV